MKSRFIADNQTDMVIEIKQKGTPDLDDGLLDDRCARRLMPRERCASLFLATCIALKDADGILCWHQVFGC